MSIKEVKKSAVSSLKPFYKLLPVMVGVILLISLISTLVPKEIYPRLFGFNNLIDPLIGASLGSILAGNPITSFILGGEFLKLGVSLIAVTAFLTAWVTVGIVQLPAEIYMLGKKFSITRNILSFIFSIIIAILIALVL